MADALVYVDKVIGCDEIIELSTLTGACMVSAKNQIFLTRIDILTSLSTHVLTDTFALFRLLWATEWLVFGQKMMRWCKLCHQRLRLLVRRYGTCH